MNNKITIRNLCALLCADIDIKLLRKPDQETDLIRKFNVSEIRSQIEDSMIRVINVLEESNYNIDKTIEP
jgi:hypothetical protein